MPRDPRQIQLEIDAARESLAATLDELAFRTSPATLKAKGREAFVRFLQTPAGKATVAGAGLLVTLVVVNKIRARNAADVRHPAPSRSGPGQESVWDYPRPPSAQVTARHVVVELRGRVIADSTRAIRVCETSHPPVFYVPRDDVADGVLERASGSSWCEWKGAATYWDAVVDGHRVRAAAWSYEDPTPGFAQLRGAVAFYPDRVDRALVDGELVRAQPGGFYGGWMTDEVAGPFKGEPGTLGW